MSAKTTHYPQMDDCIEHEQACIDGSWRPSYTPKVFWRGVLALSKMKVAPGLVPPRSPREEALAQIKAAEKRQADGLVRPFSAAQYKRWSMDPRPRPLTYYDGTPRPDVLQRVLAEYRTKRKATRPRQRKAVAA